jgi:NAD(P)-dependent dehydrogenase (short-subunit alcohol dehydrogenase family)
MWIEIEDELIRRTVLVTGGSKGIGLAVVKQFLKEGHRVISHFHKNPIDTKNLP